MPPSRRLPVDAIRDAARLAVEATSLRSVARAVGMSPMGLRHFLDGRRPYTATARKLGVWYVGWQSQQPGSLPADAARAALVLLLDGVPETGRGRGAAILLDAVERVHEEMG